MALCCGSNGIPFIQTRFLGASIARFSTQVDWNGSGGGLQVELVEDLCAGDAFTPPQIGSPVFFQYGGLVQGGILQNWKQNESANGPKSYTVNVVSPRDLVVGCDCVLSSYSGPTYSVPNLANVYGWLEENLGPACSESGYTGGVLPGFSSNLTYPPAAGFGGAQQNDTGIPWYLVKTALNAILNGSGGVHGNPITFRGHRYLFDLSELPSLNAQVHISGENMNLDDLIAHVCGLGGVDYFYELITVGTVCGAITLQNIIKVRTTRGSSIISDESARNVDNACNSQIDARLSLGTIGSTIASSTCVNRYGRGLELRHDVTNAFLTGDFRKEVYQIEYEGDCDGTSDTIWPYWGKNPDGTIIMGEECSDGTFPKEINDLDYGHHFVADVSHLGVGVDEWDVTMFELQAALVGEENWRAWLWEKEPEKFASILGLAAHDIRGKGPGTFIGKRLQQIFDAGDANNVAADKTGIKGPDLLDMSLEEMKKLDAFNLEKYRQASVLYDFVRKFAQEFHGRQFMVKLPFLCQRFTVDEDNPWTTEKNWEPTDSGWTEWPVLGIPNNHWILDQFRADDGKITCFVKYVSDTPMKLDNLSKTDYFALDGQNVFVSGTCEEIIWVNDFDDARAVVKITGPVQKHNPYGILPEWLMSFALTQDYNNANDKDKFMNAMASLTNDKFALGMKEPFLMPVAAAIPLQSTRLVYGPWFAKENDFDGYNFFLSGAFGGSDNGKTIYQRESGFAPWNFGTFALMDWVAYSTATAMLGDKYVVEMGDITFPGAPAGSVGDLLVTGGPIVSHIDVQVGRGTGAVTTTYRMKTHTPDTNKLAKQRLDQIRHAAQIGIKANRMFKKYTIDRLRNQFDTKIAQQLLQWKVDKGLDANSSHDMMGGQAFLDPDGPALTTSDVIETRFRHGQNDVPITTKQPVLYEEPDQDDEPHGSTASMSSEGRKDMRMLRADVDHAWRRRAYMDQIGMFRPFSTLPHNQKAIKDDAYFMPHWRNEINKDKVLSGSCGVSDGDSKLSFEPGCPSGEQEYMTKHVEHFSHEQVPPIFCKEQQLPINITTLSPFLSKGRSTAGLCMTKSPDTSAGHDIEYIARDGVYPTNLSVRHPNDNYSAEHWYRAVGLRSPLILAGWGFDIDNKPVPNESTTYPANPKMKFEQDWLRKPQKWMCGPLDVRWDYKRQVWTAPTAMKIVRLELAENLCVGQCANAILYNDQEQYDYDGNPIATEYGCGDKCGYLVKVWNDSMQPVIAGWRITAYFDTTLNQYRMLSHDPLPIVEVNVTTMGANPCDTMQGTIVGPAGDCGSMDPCDALNGLDIELVNTLNQPICPPRKVYAWICRFDCDGEGEEGPELDGCRKKCLQPVKAYGAILQAEFKPECVVTHLELLEYYAWGYDELCDEDDLTIFSQGEVETCWDACLKVDGVACLPEQNLTTDVSAVNASGCGVTITGSATVDGQTSSYSHSHSVTSFSGNIPSFALTGLQTDGYTRPSHTCPVSVDVIGSTDIDGGCIDCITTAGIPLIQSCSVDAVSGSPTITGEVTGWVTASGYVDASGDILGTVDTTTVTGVCSGASISGTIGLTSGVTDYEPSYTFTGVEVTIPDITPLGDIVLTATSAIGCVRDTTVDISDASCATLSGTTDSDGGGALNITGLTVTGTGTYNATVTGAVELSSTDTCPVVTGSTGGVVGSPTMSLVGPTTDTAITITSDTTGLSYIYADNVEINGISLSCWFNTLSGNTGSSASPAHSHSAGTLYITSFGPCSASLQGDPRVYKADIAGAIDATLDQDSITVDGVIGDHTHSVGTLDVDLGSCTWKISAGAQAAIDLATVAAGLDVGGTLNGVAHTHGLTGVEIDMASCSWELTDCVVNVDITLLDFQGATTTVPNGTVENFTLPKHNHNISSIDLDTTGLTVDLGSCSWSLASDGVTIPSAAINAGLSFVGVSTPLQSGEATIAISNVATYLECDVSGSLTMFDGDLPDHQHGMSFTATGDATCPSWTHSHPLDGVTIPKQGIAFVGGQTDIDTHSHAIANLTLSGNLAGTVDNCPLNHDHDFTIPCTEVTWCGDATFDLDIDSRFIPGSCTIRVSVVNKNFWEYYWYTLCICTRAIWHEAEFGPAVCDLNVTPDCDTDCEDIDCGDPVYNCPGKPAHNRPTGGEDVSWFGQANDDELVSLDSNCINDPQAACDVSATCAAPVVAPDCCTSCGTTIDETSSGVASGSSVNQGGALVDFCPAGAPIDFDPSPPA